MSSTRSSSLSLTLSELEEDIYDILIIGAGLSGICALHHLRERFPEWRVGLVEAGSGPGGTWYWNSYPGARLSSESASYAFSWDPELLEQWLWKETFASQPEVLEYVEFVCKKHDLYKDMHFNTRIEAAEWFEDAHMWGIFDQMGEVYWTTFLVSCMGFLSLPTLPKIPGMSEFQGKSFHTSRWPRDLLLNRDFAGQRVGIIGTGASSIQIVPEMAKAPGLKSLHVFQRTPNWAAPLHNREVTADQMDEYKKHYRDIFSRCAETPASFVHAADPRKSFDVAHEDRLALWEKLYSDPGYGKWLDTFSDTYNDPSANKLYSTFMAYKIRSRVRDPATATRLIPTTHGFGTRPLPLESGYFEAFNAPSAHLVDISTRGTPIKNITSHGLTLADGTTHDLDTLIYATGFDAITGSFHAIDFHACFNRHLIATPPPSAAADDATAGLPDAIWPDHRPRTHLGITAPDLPNVAMVLGPHQPLQGNATRCIEHVVGVVADLLGHCAAHGYTYFEPTEEAAAEWMRHIAECAEREGGLGEHVDSWVTGVNRNVQGKEGRCVVRYPGSAVEYRRRCEEIKRDGWRGLRFGAC